MRRVKFIKDFKGYKKGDTVFLTPNEAHGVIDAGFAVISKDMTMADMKATQLKTKADRLGRP